MNDAPVHIGNIAGLVLFSPAGGMRWSTVLMGAALVVVGCRRRGVRYAVLAAAAWLFGFEVAWQVTAELAGHGPGFVPVLSRALWVAWPVAAFYAGVRVDWRMAAVTAVLWVAWVATGFHSNGHNLAGFDPLAEALNEASKTAWGVAYLLPMLGVRAYVVDLVGTLRQRAAA